MPTYTYCCPICNGEQDELRSIDDRDATMRCSCGGEMTRIVALPSVRPDVFDWSNENGGKGRLISQLQRKPGKPSADCYCRNRQEIFDKCAKKGWGVEKVY